VIKSVETPRFEVWPDLEALAFSDGGWMVESLPIQRVRSATMPCAKSDQTPNGEAGWTTSRLPISFQTTNIGGFSDAVFKVVSAFLRQEPGRFVAEVEAIEL
jgi:hypothetical protein